MQGRPVKNIKPEEKQEPLSQGSAVLKELREQRLISLFEDFFSPVLLYVSTPEPHQNLKVFLALYLLNSVPIPHSSWALTFENNRS